MPVRAAVATGAAAGAGISQAQHTALAVAGTAEMAGVADMAGAVGTAGAAATTGAAVGDGVGGWASTCRCCPGITRPIGGAVSPTTTPTVITTNGTAGSESTSQSSRRGN